jgi:hypothetical protein
VKVLSEYIDEGLEVVAEERGGKKEWYIRGPMICAEKLNANGRIYRADSIAKEVDRYIREVVNQNKAVGELNHGPTPNINYEKASHIVKELRREGNVWVGKAKILDTPMGRIAKSLIEEKIPLGVSTRGVGSVTKDVSTGAMIVGDDFRLSCIDIVSQPSGPGCYAEGLYENAPDFVLNEDTGEWVEQGEDTVEEDDTQEDAQIFMDYLTNLEEKIDALTLSQRQLLEGADTLLDEFRENLLDGMVELSGDQDKLLENQEALLENQNDLAEHHDDILELIMGLAKSLGKEEELKKIAARIRSNSASSSGSFSDVVSRDTENSAANRKSVSTSGGSGAVHEALGELLTARPGAGILSPGVRVSSNAPMLTEEQQTAINEAEKQRAARMETEKARVEKYAAYINRTSKTSMTSGGK